MGNMNVGAKASEWQHKGVNSTGGGIAKAAEAVAQPLTSIEPDFAPPAPELTDRFKEILPGRPAHPVEPCIGLQLHSNPIEEINRIRSSKGMTQVQALMEFKDTLSQASDAGLEKAQTFLADAMASPSNSDDELLATLLKAVNHELNSRHGRLPAQPIWPQPHPVEFPPRPWDEHIHLNGNDRVAD